MLIMLRLDDQAQVIHLRLLQFPNWDIWDTHVMQSGDSVGVSACEFLIPSLRPPKAL